MYKNIACYIVYVFLVALPTSRCMSRFEHDLDATPDSAQAKSRELDRVYSSGRYWIQGHEMGIKYCAIQGTLAFVTTSARGERTAATPASRLLLLNLWTRMKTNATHVKVIHT
jgi:hypothetical protein